MAAQTVVIVAARNEAERIGATLAALAHAFPHAPLWVADDGSRDRTAEIARAAGARVLSTGRPLGKGGALSAAAREALRHLREAAPEPGERTVVLLCDGDLGGSARVLTALTDVVRAGEADVAVAAFSRRVGGGLGITVGFARAAIARRCGLRTRAPLSGQRAISADALAQLLPFASGFGMEVAMTIDAVRAGLRVSELELDLSHRASGLEPAGFAHRARQLADIVRAYLARG
ncbi:MAG: hypothetical protein QOI03_452 [Solirubrobacteraceae bacterium]|nr:hypothetical protein [Solirubrobacteraceae bacterium]